MQRTRGIFLALLVACTAVVAVPGTVTACRIGLPVGCGHGVAPSGTGLGCLLLTDIL